MQKEEYTLKVSGKVLEKKTREFEQTVKFIFNQLPPECVRRSLNFSEPGVFKMSTAWQSLDAMNTFKSGPEFGLLKGALDTLAEAFKFSQGKESNSDYEGNKNEVASQL